MEPPAKLELRRITKTYRDVPAVNGVNLSVASGDSVVLLGPSGCGKTTTLRMVAGFMRPDDGEIWLDGRLAANARTMLPPERRKLGMVFQNYAVWPHKTVFGNVAYGLQIAGLQRNEIARRVRFALDMVRLSGFEDRYPAELSGGQQQRVALARAIATEPSMLLLDEPLSNLDANLREEMRTELRELQQRIGMTSLYVTHDQEEALVLADRVVVMNKGCIEQIGTPHDVYQRPASRFVAGFVGITNLIEGKIHHKDSAQQRLCVVSKMGLEICGADAAIVARSTVGDKVVVTLRPEGVVPVQPQVDGTSARLVSHSFLGNRYDLRLDIRGQPFRCHAPTVESFQAGLGRVTFDPTYAWVVAAE